MLAHNIASNHSNKDEEGQSMDSGGGGGGDGGGGGGSGGRNTSLLKPPEQILKCPRCDSSNTKFCYYNNYSLAQPRHFCKACRRYWTKGGALRNVPIGGNCRKNKKTKSCSSRFFSGDSSSSKSFGLSTLDFQLGGLSFSPRVTTANQFTSSYGNTSSNPSLVNLDPLGYNLPFSSSHNMMKQSDHHHHHHQLNNQNGGEIKSFHEVGASNHLHNNTTYDLASSIESLSSINQDLHWKLQQQRLVMLFGGGDGVDGENDQQKQKEQVVIEPHHQKLQPILFQNLEVLKPSQTSMDDDSRKDTELFFDNGYAQLNLNPATSTNSNGGGGNDQNESMNNWNGIHGWNHLNQYSSVP